MLLDNMKHTPTSPDMLEPMLIETVPQKSKTRAREEEDIDQVEPPTKKQRRVSKTVRFVEEENDLHYCFYDEDDKFSAWMQESDFSSIKQGNKETLIAILRSCGEMAKIDPSEVCLRGHEAHLEMYFFKAKRDMHKTVIRRVLLDQHEQRSTGVTDPEMLSKVYGYLSQNATRRALELAFVDALR